jgi:two-component system response regulator ResD
MGEPGEKKTILVVEDDSAIAELISTYLRNGGHEVALASSAEQALSFLDPPPCLVLLDLGLPGMDGLDFLKTLRTASEIPVIIVSARESDEEKLEGLDLGADDFITKPFSPRFLAARVNALLRRIDLESRSGGGEGARSRGNSSLQRISFGPFALDLAARILEREGRPVHLSRREFDLLSFLVMRPGRSFTARELHREVWRLEFGDISTVPVHIKRLRKKMGEDPAEPHWIRTVPGAGYRFVVNGDSA